MAQGTIPVAMTSRFGYRQNLPLDNNPFCMIFPHFEKHEAKKLLKMISNKLIPEVFFL